MYAHLYYSMILSSNLLVYPIYQSICACRSISFSSNIPWLSYPIQSSCHYHILFNHFVYRSTLYKLITTYKKTKIKDTNISELKPIFLAQESSSSLSSSALANVRNIFVFISGLLILLINSAYLSLVQRRMSLDTSPNKSFISNDH